MRHALQLNVEETRLWYASIVKRADVMREAKRLAVDVVTGEIEGFGTVELCECRNMTPQRYAAIVDAG